jgi:hypothetical protein
MKKLDFEVIKTTEIFEKNYTLHDIASEIGDKVITTSGFIVKEFGKNRRYERVWEAGEDKPDRIIFKDNKPIFLLDWKAKTRYNYIMNERAYNSYMDASRKLGIPCWVIFFVINIREKKVEDIRCIELNKAKVIERYKEWDGNIVIRFCEDELISFADFIKGVMNL